MAECASLPRCPFFHSKMAQMPAMANLIKQSLCKTDPSGCARYMVSRVKGREAVPVDLYPNDIERARKLIEAI